jgi:protein SCO1/2
MYSLNRSAVLWILAGVVLGGVVWAGWVKTMLDRGAPPHVQYLPPDPVPDFTLTESHDQTVTRADLLGKIWVADLFFTSCGTSCPVLSSVMSRLDQALGSRDDLRLVSITVTPEYDKPEVLRNYAAMYHASPKWLFLTGDRAQIVNLANKGFWLSAGTPGTVTHSDEFVLVDRTGKVRGFFDGTKMESVPLIVEAIGKLQ